jgi:hypothetical protein
VLTYTDATGSPDSITVADFWQSRQVLADLYQFAKSRRCGPWAMLGNVMLRAASVIPPDVVLPPVVGGQASLNLYVAFAGNSGDGKGAATGGIVNTCGSACFRRPPFQLIRSVPSPPTG